MNCQTFSTGFNPGDRGGSARTVMLSGIASLGVKVPTGLIDDQHRMGAGWAALIFPLRGTDRANKLAIGV